MLRVMTADDVLEVLDWLADAGVRVWVDGGWCVDALLGEQTREHADLDIAIPVEDEAAFSKAAAAQGFEVAPRPFATDFNWVLEDGHGREIDVHLVDVDDTQVGPDGLLVYGPKGLAYEYGEFGAVGIIAGREVACCSAESQVRYHTGYTPDADDFRDVLALCARFNIPLPEQYRGEPPT